MSKTSQDSIKAFNKLYRLPMSDTPALINGSSISTIERLEAFKKTLLDEISEVDDIINKLRYREAHDIPMSQEDTVNILADIADWLGDIQIYCKSELLKFGLDDELVFSIIMSSNMSKLGDDGAPLYDEHGKVLKGPRYWPPEPQLRRYIQAAIRTGYVK